MLQPKQNKRGLNLIKGACRGELEERAALTPLTTRSREREERHSLNLLLCSFELVPCTLRVAECHSLLERTSFLCPLLCVLTLRTCVLTLRTANYIRFLSARLSFVHSVYSPCAGR